MSRHLIDSPGLAKTIQDFGKGCAQLGQKRRTGQICIGPQKYQEVGYSPVASQWYYAFGFFSLFDFVAWICLAFSASCLECFCGRRFARLGAEEGADAGGSRLVRSCQPFCIYPYGRIKQEQKHSGWGPVGDGEEAIHHSHCLLSCWIHSSSGVLSFHILVMSRVSRAVCARVTAL